MLKHTPPLLLSNPACFLLASLTDLASCTDRKQWEIVSCPSLYIQTIAASSFLLTFSHMVTLENSSLISLGSAENSLVGGCLLLCFSCSHLKRIWLGKGRLALSSARVTDMAWAEGACGSTGNALLHSSDLWQQRWVSQHFIALKAGWSDPMQQLPVSSSEGTFSVSQVICLTCWYWRRGCFLSCVRVVWECVWRTNRNRGEVFWTWFCCLLR